MNALNYLVPAALVAIIMLPLLSARKNGMTRSQFKGRMATHFAAFALACAVAVAFPLVQSAAAPAEGADANLPAAVSETAAEPVVSNNSAGMAYIAAALSIGIAAVGSGIAVAAAAPAAIGAFSEDPKAFGKALIFVALGEGIALYGVLISILILNKV